MSISTDNRRAPNPNRGRALACAVAVGAAASIWGCSSGDAGGGSSGQGGASGGASGIGGGASGAPTAGTGRGGASGVAGTSGAAGSGGVSGGSGGTAGTAGTSGGAPGMGGASGGAGGGGAGGTGAAGGAPPYDPCPTNGDSCRIMPLGDSITDGCCGENTITQGASYRYELFHLALQNNKKITFVGSHQSGPNTVDNVQFPKDQEGHPGWTIADGGDRDGLQAHVAGWLSATPPDIVTLMIGTNDVGIQLDLPNAPRRLGTLLDTIITAAPKALVVLAQIVPTGTDDENARVRTFNAGVPALVKTRADAGKHVVLVDMYGAFTKNTDFKTALLANDLHPTDAGYGVMASTWWDAIGKLLPSK